MSESYIISIQDMKNLIKNANKNGGFIVTRSGLEQCIKMMQKGLETMLPEYTLTVELSTKIKNKTNSKEFVFNQTIQFLMVDYEQDTKDLVSTLTKLAE